MLSLTSCNKNEKIVKARQEVHESGHRIQSSRSSSNYNVFLVMDEIRKSHKDDEVLHSQLDYMKAILKNAQEEEIVELKALGDSLVKIQTGK